MPPTYTVEDSNIIIKSMVEYVQNYYKVHNKTPTLTNNKHPFTRKHVEKYFGNWSNLINQANLLLNRNKAYNLKCKNCNKDIQKQFKEFIKTKNDFCGHKCSASWNTKGRKVSEETKKKISDKLTVIRYTKCKMCNVEFRYYKRKRLSCSTMCLSQLKKYNNDVKNGRIIPDE